MSKVIRVQFSQAVGSVMPVKTSQRNLSAKEYEYFLVTDDTEVREDSLAVVDVSGFLHIVQVNEVLSRSTKANKYAICVFSLDEHKALLKKKDDIAALREAIIARAEESRERERLAKLAASDDVLAGMLKELDALEGGK